MTSPVERISGPSRVSTPGKRLKGRTASFTLTCVGSGVDAGTMPSSRSSASVAPTSRRDAAAATATPVAFATNGTVRDARGFASIT